MPRRHKTPSRNAAARAEWLRSLERRVKARVPGPLEAAVRCFREELCLEDQNRLAREIVETRETELRAAHPGVLDVAYGYPVHGDRRAGRPRVGKTPCVIFLVRRKWRGRATSDGALPKYLFAYWSVAGERRLCAVPTDVDSAAHDLAVRPHVDHGRALVEGAALKVPEMGAIACAVRLRREGGSMELRALSCRHFFSVTRLLHPDGVDGLTTLALLGNVASDIAVTAPIRGDLDRGVSSFDAQLSEPVLDGGSRAALADALAGLNLGDPPYASLRTEIEGASYYVRTPTGVKPATFRRWREPCDVIYEAPGRTTFVATTELLVESILTRGNTEIGDSGSPVVTEENGGKLLGMHIAGVGAVSFMIPAWMLFVPSNYIGLDDPPIEVFEPTNDVG